MKTKLLLGVIATVLAVAVIVLTTKTKPLEPLRELDGGPMGIERVAMVIGAPIPYEAASTDGTPLWVQIDLGASFPVEAVKLYPYFQDLAGPGAHSHNFPIRFRIDAADNEAFDNSCTVVDQTTRDLIAYPLEIKTYRLPEPVQARYVRLTVHQPHHFELWRFEVISGGRDIAEDKTLSDSKSGYLGQHALLRPPRPAGENVWFDHPEQVTSRRSWKPVKAPLQIPRNGVTVGGLFRQTFDRNIQYLLNSFSVHDMAYTFLERSGREKGRFESPARTWFTIGLGGAIAGRFLMGAGNSLRWEQDEELRSRIDELVDIIEECATPEGYIYGYPERVTLQGQNNAYSRSWLSQGLVDAGIAGNPKAWPLLRRGSDWFNASPYLPEMLMRVPIGNQGIIANSRTYLDTDIGVPADIQVIQRYFQLNYWLEQLARRDPAAIWQYQYERVHSYLIVALNAYMDMYMATGHQYYLDAMLGAWDILHENFTHIGGAISVIESYSFPPRQFPPKSHHLRVETGELCGNVFWAVFNEQLRVLCPDDGEKYVAEIEKSIYNIGIANQNDKGDIRYHACPIGKKDKSERTGTCCEGQGTRFYGMLPEFIYKISGDGLYVDLFNESSIAWEQDGKKLSLHQHSDFPLDPDVKLHFDLEAPVQSKIRIRVPSWAASDMDILVNGEKAASGKPGTYVTLDREWNGHDAISFTLPMGFRLTKYEGVTEDFAGKETYAMEYGPLLMGLVSNDVKDGVLKLPFAAGRLTANLKPVAGKPLHFSIAGAGRGDEYVPYYEIDDDVPFTCYPFFDSTFKE
ncbi:MAG: glycoside hydrolase family 127 protein [Prevotellaceae bacterium]|jgi:hypothetical protein|nr:glycoside hydrolase family 127 protein [Prevotellaceae bacterium]